MQLPEAIDQGIPGLFYFETKNIEILVNTNYGQKWKI